MWRDEWRLRGVVGLGRASRLAAEWGGCLGGREEGRSE